jgi:hypothetical protein
VKDHISEDKDGLEVKSPTGWTGKAQGTSVLVFLMACALGALVYAHHIQVELSLDALHADTVNKYQSNQQKTMDQLIHLNESIDANTYVLSLSQQDREKLNILMPDSMRRMRRHPDRDSP